MSEHGFLCGQTQSGYQFIRDGGRKIDMHFLIRERTFDGTFLVIEWDAFRVNFRLNILNMMSLLLSKVCNHLPMFAKLVQGLGRMFGFYGKLQYRVPAHFFYQSKTCNYFEFDVSIPLLSHLVLNELYGANWTTPTRSKYWQYFAKPSNRK